MMKTFTKVATLVFVGARIVPAVLIGTAHTVAALLAARILLTAFVGLTPVLLIAQRIPGARSSRPPLPGDILTLHP
jgi:hypothetical protein